jgi:hypothetical protein
MARVFTLRPTVASAGRNRDRLARPVSERHDRSCRDLARYHAPVMLFALLLGMAFHFLHEERRCIAGIGTILRQPSAPNLPSLMTFQAIAWLGSCWRNTRNSERPRQHRRGMN